MTPCLLGKGLLRKLAAEVAVARGLLVVSHNIWTSLFLKSRTIAQGGLLR